LQVAGHVWKHYSVETGRFAQRIRVADRKSIKLRFRQFDLRARRVWNWFSICAVTFTL